MSAVFKLVTDRKRLIIKALCYRMSCHLYANQGAVLPPTFEHFKILLMAIFVTALNLTNKRDT